MTKDIISEKEKKELEKDGYMIEYNNNILSIRRCADEILVEIVYFEEDEEFLISTSKNYRWAKEIKAISSAFGEALFIFYTEKGEEEGEIIVDN